MRIYSHWFVLSKMNMSSVVKRLKMQISQQCSVGQWFVGIRFGRRIHPYDGEELAFPTCGWIYAETDLPAEAVEVVRHLIFQGVAYPHGPNEAGKIVFAYLVRN